MTLQDDIDTIYKLDKARRQGAWKWIVCPYAPDTQYISVHGDTDPINSVIYDDGIYPTDPKDMRFIAAAPLMVSVIRRLEAENKVLRTSVDSYILASQTIIRMID
jgi:hypothetical protein